MKFQCRSFRATRLWRSALVVTCLGMFAGSVPALAADIPPVRSSGPKMAVLFSFTQPVPDTFLTALDEEVRLPARDVLPASTVWMPRDAFHPGQEFPAILQVEFRGNCAPREFPARSSPGPLGWVIHDGTTIHSIAYVECDRIAATLSSDTRALPRQERQQLLARAVARVVVHELAHIESQSAGHTPHSLRQPTFSAAELMARKLPGGF